VLTYIPYYNSHKKSRNLSLTFVYCRNFLYFTIFSYFSLHNQLMQHSMIKVYFIRKKLFCLHFFFVNFTYKLLQFRSVCLNL